ncbi:hypothetical protein L596_002349 [Steinernema carpocapsae]|uniref:Uncharacterized protein n=1 Tax=Steinernema carpocapsae TaxID=34508 RepID=A0A4U8USX8_STECR|nr:hypothetical protein L596_002349 [Steinernema carpocapsae]
MSRSQVDKNLGLLSFGDEAEDDEVEFALMNKKLKGKSAHDVLDDGNLSKELAVRPEELSNYDVSKEDRSDETRQERLSKIRQKFAKNKSAAGDAEHKAPEVDLHDVLEKAKTAEEQSKIDRIAAETKVLAREYKRALRQPKEKEEVEEEEPQSEALKEYHSSRLKFKNKSKGIVRYRDPRREEQTMTLLNKLQTSLAHSAKSVNVFRNSEAGVGHRVLPEMSNPELDPANLNKSEEKEDDGPDLKKAKTEEKELTEDEKLAQEQLQKEAASKMDFDAEDIDGDWMDHKFVAPEADPHVSKAKDANMKDLNEDWYDLSDPRNPMNIRRREDAARIE